MQSSASYAQMAADEAELCMTLLIHSSEGFGAVCRVADAPWRMPANLEDMKAFFNYDMNLHKWREYCKRVEQYRLQYTMQVFSPQLAKDSEPSGTPNLLIWDVCMHTIPLLLTYSQL